MIAEYATEHHFAKWRTQADSMSTACLRYTIKDCREAEAAMRGWNPIKEGFYSDQAATFGDELRRRGTTYSGTAQ